MVLHSTELYKIQYITLQYIYIQYNNALYSNTYFSKYHYTTVSWFCVDEMSVCAVIRYFISELDNCVRIFPTPSERFSVAVQAWDCLGP